MQFLSSKYTKMHLRSGLCPGPHWGAYSAPSNPLAAGGEGLAAPTPKLHPHAISPADLEFLAFGLKEVVHHWSNIIII